MSDVFTLDVADNGVAWLEFCRPDELNTMNLHFWTDFPKAVRELDSTGDVRVLVLASQGKHFTAGMDLAVFQDPNVTLGPRLEFSDRGRNRAGFMELVLTLQQTFSVLAEARFPTLAAVHGGCIGGGVDMVTACDCRYASSDAFFVVQETNLGLTADVGTMQRLPRIIPDGIARELAFTGDRLPAERAKEVGLVNEVYEDRDALHREVRQIADRIAAKSPLVMWGCKEMVNYTRDHTLEESLRYMALWQAAAFHGDDMAEAFMARMEKRDTNFEGLPERKGL